MTPKKEITKRDYAYRLNLIIEYIINHLDEELKLEKLAQIAGFSQYHFHRIFRSFIGETLNDFVRRSRLEKAANMLCKNPLQSVTDICFECGFSSSANFAREFKKKFGCSASDFRAGEWKKLKMSKIGKLKSKKGKDFSSAFYYYESEYASIDHKKKEELLMDVKIKEIDAFNLAYIRVLGYDPQKIYIAFNEVRKWAAVRGYTDGNTKFIGIPHDDPGITPPEKCTYYACIPIPEIAEAEGEVGIFKTVKGKYAIVHFEAKPKDVAEYWYKMFREWLPESGFQPNDLPLYEIYYNNACDHPQGKFICDYCLPVKPL